MNVDTAIGSAFTLAVNGNPRFRCGELQTPPGFGSLPVKLSFLNNS
jgi:hypothetical protein